MKNKKATQIFQTFQFSEVFNDSVFVDVSNKVVYDKNLGIAIAYILSTHTHMIISFIKTKVVDDDFNEVNFSFMDFFNKDNVVRKSSDYYFRVSNGYVYLGHSSKETGFQIRLPRLFDPADASNAPETGGMDIEVIDEDDDYFDPYDPDEFAADVEAMFD